jgi:hypothetical protein
MGGRADTLKGMQIWCPGTALPLLINGFYLQFPRPTLCESARGFSLFLPDAAHVGTHVRKAAPVCRTNRHRIRVPRSTGMVANSRKRSEGTATSAGEVSLRMGVSQPKRQRACQNRPLVLCHPGLVRCVANCIATCVARKAVCVAGVSVCLQAMHFHATALRGGDPDDHPNLNAASAAFSATS